MTVNIHNCIYQALAELRRTQLSGACQQALVGICLVSGFGGCLWDGSLSGAGKWMDLKGIILSEVNQVTKEDIWYALTDKWILAQKLGIPKVQFAKHMKLKKKENQSVHTSFLLRIWNKIPMEGVTETKCEAETEGMTIQRLPHLGIHPINNHQTQKLLWMPTRAC